MKSKAEKRQTIEQCYTPLLTSQSVKIIVQVVLTDRWVFIIGEFSK